jgi:hypothetical protein
MPFFSNASHHKRSANSRGRKKSAHNAGRLPQYKVIRRNAIAAKAKVCIRCGVLKPLTDFKKDGIRGSRTEENTADKCRSCFEDWIEERVAAFNSQRLTYKRLVEWGRAERIAPYVYTPLETLLARARPWFWTQRQWRPQEQGDLKVICLGSVAIEKAADVLGRTPYAIAYRARELQLPLPSDWAKIIAPKRIIKPRVPRFVLKYPYLAKARPSDDELVRVNNLVPHRFPDWVRADIAQSVLLAFYEGEVSIAELEAHKEDLRWFYKKYYREQEPREEVSITGNADDDRSYDDIAASRKYYQTLERHEEAIQIQYVWERERSAARFMMAGKIANLRDVDDMLERGEIKIGELKLHLFRPWDRIRKHARARLKQRFGIELDRQQAEALVNFCRQRSPDDRDRHRELHILRSGRGPELPVVYDRKVNEIISVLPEGGGLGGSAWRSELAVT